jgi:hypothetical protein
VEVRELADADRDWVERLIVERWGAAGVVGRGRVWNPAELPGFAAFEDERCVGLVTYELDGEACEVVTLDALEEGRGIGTALLRAVEGMARGRSPSTRSAATGWSGSSPARSTKSGSGRRRFPSSTPPGCRSATSYISSFRSTSARGGRSLAMSAGLRS